MTPFGLGASWGELLLAALAMALGGLIQSSVGLGFALTAIPLLALINTDFIPGPVILSGGAMCVLIVWRGRRHVDAGEIGWGLIGLCAGTALGAAGLWLIPASSARYAFGALILVAVAISVFAPPLRLSRPNLIAAGTASGVIGTMAGMHGPPLALVYQNEEPERVRVMLSAFFMPATLITIFALALLGRFGWRELYLALLLVPGTIVGFLLAPLVARRLDRRKTRYAVLTIAAVSAVTLFF